MGAIFKMFGMTEVAPIPKAKPVAKASMILNLYLACLMTGLAIHVVKNIMEKGKNKRKRSTKRGRVVSPSRVRKKKLIL